MRLPPPTVDVTIVILSWNARSFLRRCLASLYRPGDAEVAAAWARAGRPPPAGPGDSGLSWETIVVDQESLDGSADLVAAEFPEARLIIQRPNLGFAGGNNVALRETRGRFVVLLNSDTVTPPGWLTPLVDYATARPKVGLLAPRLLNPDGSLQYSCRRFPTLGAGFFRNTPFEFLAPRNRFTADYLMRDWAHDEPRAVDWLSGACLMARRELIEAVGGLDEGYFMYFEDVEWSRRAWDAGWEVHYLPEPVVLHEVGKSSDRRPKRMIVMHHQSAYRYFRKYSRIGRSPMGPLLLGGGLAARALLTLARNEALLWRGRLRGGRS
jgi:GT2 family glycosyltransferase